MAKDGVNSVGGDDELLAEGCRRHPGMEACRKYRVDIAATTHKIIESLGDNPTQKGSNESNLRAPCAQEDPNWTGTAPSPCLDTPSQ